jgi:hypothetical protein
VDVAEDNQEALQEHLVYPVALVVEQVVRIQVVFARMGKVLPEVPVVCYIVVLAEGDRMKSDTVARFKHKVPTVAMVYRTISQALINGTVAVAVAQVGMAVAVLVELVVLVVVVMVSITGIIMLQVVTLIRVAVAVAPRSRRPKVAAPAS